MKRTATILVMLIRLTGIIQVVLGLLFWTGNMQNLIPIHMLIGVALVVCLWLLAIVAAFARVHWGLVAFAIIWGIFVPVFGVMQGGLLPGSFHWIIQVLHLAVGLAAMGLGDTLARRIKTYQAPLPA